MKYAVFSLLLLLTFTACDDPENSAAPVPESVYSHVYAYTSGTVSRTEPVKIRFVRDAVSEEETGKTIGQNLLFFTPSIMGKAVWEDRRTLTFTPDEMLDPGKVYVGTVRLGKIFREATGDAASFEFEFRTRDLTFAVKKEGFRSPDPDNLAVQEYTGTVVFSDYVTDTAAEEAFKAFQGDNNLEIEWTHAPDGMNHDFVIKNIRRKEEATAFTLQKAEIDYGGDDLVFEEITVPGLNDFKVVSATVTRAKPQFISLNFSDPLQRNQDLEGMVVIGDFAGKLRYSIDGNQLLVYPSERIQGTRTVSVKTGIMNSSGRKMKDESTYNLVFEEEKPQVNIVGRGVILPSSEGLLLPIEAVNLNAVEVEIFKIFHNNILQFLQNNQLDGTGYQLEKVGRIVAQKKIDLRELDSNPNRGKKVRYALDLSDLVRDDPEAIYQVRVGFRPKYTDYYCGEKSEDAEELTPAATDTYAEDGEFTSIWGSYYGIDGYYRDYDYDDREDPCKGAYYSDRNFDRRNIVASDLGIICKEGNDKTVFTAVSNLKTTDPIAGATLNFYDYQQQLIKTVKTDSDGMNFTEVERSPAFVIAESKGQKGYLRLIDGAALSLSRFDIGGAETQRGMKGFIYGERGVWRPGDSLFLNFILEQKNSDLPEGLPINFALYDPRGQEREKRTIFENTGGIYALHTSTSAEAPTGNWSAVVKVGGATFRKTIKVETVKPNRLKADLDFGKEVLTPDDTPISAQLTAAWLHGAPAKDLQVKTEMQVRPAAMQFGKFSEFRFTDPARSWKSSDSEVKVVFDGKTDAQGKASFTTEIYDGDYAPGKLRAEFKTRVFEKGGDFSTATDGVDYHPFSDYTGIRIPKNSWGSKRIEVDKRGTLEFAAVDTDGNPLAGKNLSVGIYRAEWRWWWDSGRDNVASFSSSNHNNAKFKGEVKTNATGTATYDFAPKEWGRYLVRVCDTESGHCAGDYFYSGYPWYDEDGDNDNNREGATMLTFAAGKEKYEVGETIEINVPANEISRVLVTLETGTKVVKSFWREAKKGENTFRFQATPEMSPTVYAHVSLLQPHAQTVNDLPIRMYGVIPVSVENPETQLQPKIEMAEELKPEQKFTVKVSEDNNKAMAYTLAVVDDGLLDLTNFKTPDPHGTFYAREALGVKTFDLYDLVLGAFGGDLSRVLSIGGDGEAEVGDKKKANRFKPVVRHLGPFYLAKGKTATHEITMPNYVGSVRVMVVAGNKNAAYGKAEKTVPVRKPLMVLATLPRVLGPGETLRLPISVFAMDKKVKNATITVTESSGLVGLSDEGKQSLSFSEVGEKMTYFDLKVAENTGIAKFDIQAEGAGETASQQIEIDVRNPNPFVTNVESKILRTGEKWEVSATPVGIAGTNSAVLEVSNLPPLDLGRRLRYLLGYPYGCLEQTVSKAFPQLYLSRLVDLKDNQKASIPDNIQAGINKLADFRLSNGSFAYWPGNRSVNNWSNIYAFHFLTEAEKAGYNLPGGMKNAWVTNAAQTANIYDPKQEEAGFYYRDAAFTQAYRLYVLALAGEPATGAMNRLRENQDLSGTGKWLLAGAYAHAGKPEVAKTLTKNLSTTVENYRELGNTFGSSLRDKAIILEVLNVLREEEKGMEVVKNISEQISNGGWYSTQETAFALVAVSKFIGDSDISSTYNFKYRLDNGTIINAGSSTPITNIDVPMSDAQAQAITVDNTSSGVLYARLMTTGQPATGDQTATAEKIAMSVKYRDSAGKTLDPTRIVQGTDFMAEVTIKHPGQTYKRRYDEMALDQIFPSGWEIINTRTDNLNQDDSKVSRPDYQDIRDDRVYTFFDIGYGNSQTYRVRLNAAYPGRYYLPTVSCSAMYDAGIQARQPGQWVEVIPAE